MEDPYMLEEYKLAKERIGTHLLIAYRLLILNVTGFAAILGLSEQLATKLVPLALLTLLLICSTEYTLHMRMHRWVMAYLIERYEKARPRLALERSYQPWRKHREGIREQNLGRRAWRVMRLVRTPPSRAKQDGDGGADLSVGKRIWRNVRFWLDPFALLTIISVTGGAAITYQSLAWDWYGGHYLKVCVYVAPLLVGHGIVIANVRERKQWDDLRKMCAWWSVQLSELYLR